MSFGFISIAMLMKVKNERKCYSCSGNEVDVSGHDVYPFFWADNGVGFLLIICLALAPVHDEEGCVLDGSKEDEQGAHEGILLELKGII